MISTIMVAAERKTSMPYSLSVTVNADGEHKVAAR
jgi:hypothetical protein